MTKKTRQPAQQPARHSKQLTRSQVADLLGVSISTVRRLEGNQLHPQIGPRGVRHFSLTEVKQVSLQLPSNPQRAKQATPRQRSPGETAAEVFGRFERRQGLSEIVRALRLDPRTVRRLYHEWRTSLERHEQENLENPAPPVSQQKLPHGQLRELLASLPTDQMIELGVGRKGHDAYNDIWHYIPVYDECPSYRTYAPVTILELWHRYGDGKYRVTASVDGQVLWEVLDEFKNEGTDTS